MSVFLQKSTPCGRFTVYITSDVPESHPLLVQDGARSLKHLSDLLSEASTLALKVAVTLLETHKPAPDPSAS